MSTQLVAGPDEKVQPTLNKIPASTSATTIPTVTVFPTPAATRPLFSQSFVEESGGDRRRKRVTQASSFLVQTIILGILVLIPLWFTDVLPVQQLATFLVAPPPPPPPPPPAAPAVKVERVSEVVNGQLRTPSKIPEKVKMLKEEETPPLAGVIGGVQGGVPGGQINGVLGALLPTAHNSNNAAYAPPPPKRVRVSTGISEGMLTRKIDPVYPVIASRAHIQGTVQLRAVISREGNIENLQLINGHPLLVQSAMDAVKQWKYRPYILNGEPLEVETIVIVNFRMG